MLDAMPLRSGDEDSTGELRPVVGAHGQGAAEARGLIERAHHVCVAHAMVGVQIHALGVKSAATVRYLIRRPLSCASLTMSISRPSWRTDFTVSSDTAQ